MRREYCQVPTVRQARTQCPWAAKIYKVAGGYLAFASWADAQIWRAQR